jgi:hypothetical protein
VEDAHGNGNCTITIFSRWQTGPDMISMALGAMGSWGSGPRTIIIGWAIFRQEHGRGLADNEEGDTSLLHWHSGGGGFYRGQLAPSGHLLLVRLAIAIGPRIGLDRILDRLQEDVAMPLLR